MFVNGRQLKRLENEILWTRLEHNGPYVNHNLKTPYQSLSYALWLYTRVPRDSRTGKYFWANVYRELKDRGYRGTGEKQELQKLVSEVDYEYEYPEEESFEKYKFCILDGKLEAIQQWKMEPPFVYLSRGDHPQKGRIKPCIQPEDITINCSNGKIPNPPEGRSWKRVVHNRSVRWLWSWYDSLTGKIKYVYPAMNSDIHSESEIDKFNLAKRLGTIIDRVREDYMKLLPDELGCVMYIIDRFGIRVGNETNTDEVSGATTLRGKNLILDDSTETVRLRFLGKDSIPYDNNRRVSREVYRALKRLKSKSGLQNPLFPNVSSRRVNEYLNGILPGLTAKVFRTFNAGQILTNCLERANLKSNRTTDEWLEVFKAANYEVSKYCNHKNKKSDYSLSTSIINYIDPRIVVGWAESKNIPLERIYPKTLLKRFSWAINKNGN